MHAMKLLHTLFDNACQTVDKRLKRTLFEAAESLTKCKQLSIVSVGRHLNRKANVKNNIKCIDRLFGNENLHKKRGVFYQEMARRILKNNKMPIILVDWSGLTPCGTFHFLRASVAVNGRALTLFEQAYSFKHCFKEATHCCFLREVKKLLPSNCCPIVVTDAGFRNSWFKAVNKMGWDFLGRVRNLTKYTDKSHTLWKPIKSLYKQATFSASYVGQVYLAQGNPLACHFYLMKQRKMNRVKRNLAGKKIQCSVSIKHEKRENEPWLIASSLCYKKISAVEVMMIYKKRMQIEESFRDLKNTRNGFGLRHCRSFHHERLNIALLISALATFALWIIGVATKNRNLHYTFQTNTTKIRNVLSDFMIAWQALMRENIRFTKAEHSAALDVISKAATWSILC
jgi:hypothetical protein